MRSATMHVGVNVSNTGQLLMVQPVFVDGSFIFVPIPNLGEGTTYAQLRASLPGVCEVLTQLGFSEYLEVHNDPEFVGCTFGEGPRKWMLAELCPQDYIFFVSSMKKIQVPSKGDFLRNPEKYRDKLWKLLRVNRGPDWFYGLFAHIKISKIYAGKKALKLYKFRGEVCELNASVADELKTNAHIKRSDHLSGDCIVIKGESKVYEQAFPISQGNTCLTRFQDIFYNKGVLKRNGRKWFEAILGKDETTSLLNSMGKGSRKG